MNPFSTMTPDGLRDAIAFFRAEHQRSERMYPRERVTLEFCITGIYVCALLGIAAYDYVLTAVCVAAAILLRCGAQWREQMQEQERAKHS